MKSEKGKRGEEVTGTDTLASGEPPAQKRLRHIGVIEGVSFLLLLGVAVPLKHLLGLPLLVRVLGPIHGGLFILYVAAVFQAARALRWSARQTSLALAAGVLPGGTFVLDARLRKPRATL